MNVMKKKLTYLLILTTLVMSTVKAQSSYPDAELEKAFKLYVKAPKNQHIITEGFAKFAYNQTQQPIVQTTPFQETVISLEAGEHFTNVTSGDPSRWSYAAAVSGAGELEQQHILVKPSEPRIATNMVITTDKRIYNLRLVSVEGGSTKAVSFWYPEDMLKKVAFERAKRQKEEIIQIPKIGIDDLNFDYILKASAFCLPKWRPLRVFDDGAHTYIEFPKNVLSRDLPAIFTVENAATSLVNFRVKMPYIIVDKIFAKGLLVLGTGKWRQTITILNKRF
jgi:P-type conjugative transfer protein TrbG